MLNFYEELENYFANTPQEKIVADWGKSEHYDHVGPTADELLMNLTLFHTHSCEPSNLRLSPSNNIYNPEFSSGFLFFTY